MAEKKPTQASFAEIAVGLLEFMLHQRKLNKFADEFSGEVRSLGIETPGLDDHLAQLKWREDMLAEGFAMFKAMSEHEAEIRRIIGRSPLKIVGKVSEAS